MRFQYCFLVVFGAVVSYAQEFDDIFSMLGQMGKQGGAKAPICGANEIAVQVLDIEPESNGCSKPPGIRIGGEEDFTYCCDRHDACYSTCNVPKSYCDKDFDKCMQKMCNTIFAHNNQCSQAASMYSMGTMAFGQVGYADTQDTYCTCISSNPSEEKAVISEHYTRLLQGFYGKYAGGSAAVNVAEIVTSAKWSDKLHMLYYTLLKKYDNAIAHTEGRKGKKNIPKPLSSAPEGSAETAVDSGTKPPSSVTAEL
jgi:secretory phospholipase A2